MSRQNIFLGLVFGCFCLLFTTPAAAHANLVTSSPSPGATLPTAPLSLQLSFTEALEPAFVRLRLFDSTGAALTMGDSSVSPDTPAAVSAPFPPDLPDGLYTVSWRVVSAADGHATEGAFTFAVGVEMIQGGAGSPTDSPTVALSAVAVRWVNLIALALLIGALGFSLTVSNSLPRRWFAVGWVAAGVGGLLVLVTQAAVAADVSPFSSAIGSAVGQVLNGTAFGSAWLTRTVAWGVVGVILWRSPSRRARLLALALGAVMLYAHALSSHAAARVDHPEAVLLDALHSLASSLWIGGLVAFSIVLWNARKRDTVTLDASILTVRFSRMARLCVLILTVTGVYSALLHVGSVEALTATGYGRALTVKTVLFIATVGLAAINLFFTEPALKRGQKAWVGVLRGLIMMELVLTGGVIIGAAWMTSDMPAADAYRLQQAAAAPQPVNTSFFEMNVVDDKMLHLDIAPGVVGENTFSLTLFNADGSPMTDASRVGLRFTHLDNLVAESTLKAEHVGFGVYRVTGANLSVPGRWRVRLTIRQPAQFDVVTDFEVTLP